jgi:chromosome segregation ATPase
MSEEKGFYCDVCDQDFDSEYHRGRHLTSRNHREKVDTIIAEDEGRVSASKSELATVKSELAATEQRLKSSTEEIEDNENVLNAQRDDIAANDVVRKQQLEQIDALKPESERVEALRSERKTLESAVQALKVENSQLSAEKLQLSAQLTALKDDIQKTVAMRPELEEKAREIIVERLLKEEEQKLYADRRERLEDQRLYQMGEIRLDEYVRRRQARIVKNQNAGELEE